MIKDLIVFPDSRLRMVSTYVEVFDNEFKQVCTDLKDSLKYYSGVGLSAIQLGIPKRVFVMWVNESILTLVNPTWVPTNPAKVLLDEGCLSIPGYHVSVDRYHEITVRFKDENGNDFVETFQALQAQCVQHEAGHLDGMLSVDHVSRLKREMIRKKLLKLKNRAG